jgi:hypothetical protein
MLRMLLVGAFVVGLPSAHGSIQLTGAQLMNPTISLEVHHKETPAAIYSSPRFKPKFNMK